MIQFLCGDYTGYIGEGNRDPCEICCLMPAAYEIAGKFVCPICKGQMDISKALNTPPLL